MAAARKSSPAALVGDTALDKVAGVIQSMFKSQEIVVKLDPNALATPLPHYSTGSFVLDYLIGGKLNAKAISPCPGIPGGRLTQIYGMPSSGKTTIALTTCAGVAAIGGCALYIDWENEVVPGYAQQLGVPIGDPKKFMLIQPDTLEDGMKVAWAAAASGVDLIVFDSVGAGVPEAVFNLKVEEQGKETRMAANATKWSNFLPKFKTICRKSGTAVLGISQMRANPGAQGHGEKTTVQGGNAWQFFSAVRFKLARVSQIKGKRVNRITNAMEEVSVGGHIKAQIQKCKISDSQGADQLFYIRWGTGIDNMSSYVDIGQSYKVITKAGSWYSYKDLKFQGSDKLIEAIEADPDLLAEFKREVLAALFKADYAKSSTDEVDDAEDLVGDLLSEMPDLADSAPAILDMGDGMDGDDGSD